MTTQQAWAIAAFAVVIWSMAQLWFAQLVIYPLFAQVGASGPWRRNPHLRPGRRRQAPPTWLKSL